MMVKERDAPLDVLLICPNYYSDVFFTDAIVYPTNLAALAAYLRERDIKVAIIDGRALNYQLEDYRTAILRLRPRIVGITVMTSYVNQAVEIAGVVKSVATDTRVIVGGAHISALPYDSLRDYPDFDIAVVGEGEVTLHALAVKILNADFDFSGVDGIFYRDGGEIRATKPRALVRDLDSLPLPAYDLLPLERYRPTISWIKKLPSMMIYTARGCPYNCAFCASHVNFGRTVRYRSPEKILEEIELYRKLYGIRQVIFYDDMLIINRKQIDRLCDLLIERRTGLVWGCFSTVERMDEALARKMKKAGCFMIYFGLESGSEDMLKRMNKSSTSIALARDVIGRVRKAGITPVASFMFGFPGDNEENLSRTISFALSLPIAYATFVTVVPFPGSQVFTDARARGLLPEKITDWSNFEEFREPFVLSEIPRERLLHHMKLAYRKFYLRLPVMLRVLNDSRSVFRIAQGIKTAVRMMKFALTK